jgi:hypothetical protein
MVLVTARSGWWVRLLNSESAGRPRRAEDSAVQTGAGVRWALEPSLQRGCAMRERSAFAPSSFAR